VLHTGRQQVAGIYCQSGQRSRYRSAGRPIAPGGLPGPNLPIVGLGLLREGWQEWQGSNLRPPVLETEVVPSLGATWPNNTPVFIRRNSSFYGPCCPMLAATGNMA
jgi:hypothetical protein